MPATAAHLPYEFVNLRTGQTGTLLPEFGTLSKLTGNPVYYDTAKRATGRLR